MPKIGQEDESRSGEGGSAGKLVLDQVALLPLLFATDGVPRMFFLWALHLSCRSLCHVTAPVLPLSH